MPPTTPPQVLDRRRLAHLKESGILDSPPEATFDRLTRLASHLLDAPVALASFVDADRQFFKSRFGDIPEPWASARQTPLSHSFCQHVVASGEPLVISDARSHPLVKDNLAIEDLGVIAYAGAPIHSRHGDVLGSFCVVDVAEREWTAREVEILTDLAASVDAEIALRQAREDAEAASRAKSEFLANMSHEIRTPMNAVIGVTELLLGTELNDEQREYVEIVRTAGDSLLEVINDILDLSRIEAGRLELDPVPFLLQDLLTSLRALDFRARQKNLAFQVVVEEGVPPAFVGDRGRIQQVLVNLVGNALKFTQQGEITVQVAAGSSRDGLVPVHFSVRDTGIGIKAERRDAIFESFSQEDASTTRRFGGTGLGLTISRNLTHLMAGRIWLESEVGVGSTFHVELPLPACAPPATGEEAAVDAPGRSLRVLVADDNPVNQLVARRMLERDGHRVTVVCDGSQVLEVLAQGGVDVVLMDIQMPVLDGLETAREQRRREGQGHPHVPIVALTAHAMTGDRERALEAGMDGYLSKPLRPAELRAALDVHVGGAAPPDTGAPVGSDLAAPTRETLLGAVWGEEDLLQEVARVWAETHAEFLRDVRDAVQKKDAVALNRSAHRIKGAALSVGAHALSLTSRVLEDLGAAGEVTAEATSALDSLEAQMDELTAVMAEILETA